MRSIAVFAVGALPSSLACLRTQIMKLIQYIEEIGSGALIVTYLREPAHIAVVLTWKLPGSDNLCFLVTCLSCVGEIRDHYFDVNADTTAIENIFYENEISKKRRSKIG